MFQLIAPIVALVIAVSTTVTQAIWRDRDRKHLIQDRDLEDKHRREDEERHYLWEARKVVTSHELVANPTKEGLATFGIHNAGEGPLLNLWVDRAELKVNDSPPRSWVWQPLQPSNGSISVIMPLSDDRVVGRWAPDRGTRDPVPFEPEAKLARLQMRWVDGSGRHWTTEWGAVVRDLAADEPDSRSLDSAPEAHQKWWATAFHRLLSHLKRRRAQ